MGKHSKADSKPYFKKQNYGGRKDPNRKSNWQNKGNSNDRYSHVPKATLREDQVGITEYVSSSEEGFTAVIKSRYSDFHVNEIDTNDEVLILTDLSIPKADADAPLDENEQAKIRDSLKDVISEQTWDKINQLAEAPKSGTTTAEPIDININLLDKDKRTQVHALLKQLYAGKLVSSTISSEVSGAQVKFLRIAKPIGNRNEKRQKWNFPGEYVQFLVHKENVETIEVASHLAQNLKLMPSKVNFCGTKDKRAITTQKFSIKRRTPSDIVAATRSLRNVKIGNFTFSQNVLKLGDLHGNRFRIALRHITAEQSLIERALLQLRECGFINYYGMQRFGNCVDIPTYEIGVAIMKADYKKACELILKPRSSDPPYLKEIRETWWKNRDSKEAAAMIYSNRLIEKRLLDGLAKYGENDFATALRKLPRNLLLLYPHAFQSLVFNRIASKRIKHYGLKIMPGDLVYRNKTDVNEDDVQFDEMLETTDDANDDDVEMTSDCDETTTKNLSTKTDENKNSNEIEVESEFKRKVIAVKAEDIENEKYTIYDVVLPLPGYDIKYPENILDDWYKEILNEFGLTSETLNHNVKTFKMAGAYRRLVVLPKKFSWQFRNYAEDNSQLIRSDLDDLRNNKTIELSENEGKQRALLLDFCLPTSCYATMLLRELLKADTSSANQVLLETAAKEQAKDIEEPSVPSKKPENIRKRNMETSKSDVENDVEGKPAIKTARNINSTEL